MTNVLQFPGNHTTSQLHGQFAPANDDGSRAAPSAAMEELLSDPRGRSGGFKDFRVRTQGETREWRRLARAHEEARLAFNAVVRAPDWLLAPRDRRGRSSANVVHIADHRAPSTDALEAAERLYRHACVGLLLYKQPKPRHILTLVRCAAEIANVADPVWSHAQLGHPESRADVAFCYLYDRLRRAGEAHEEG